MESGRKGELREQSCGLPGEVRAPGTHPNEPWAQEGLHPTGTGCLRPGLPTSGQRPTGSGQGGRGGAPPLFGTKEPDELMALLPRLSRGGGGYRGGPGSSVAPAALGPSHLLLFLPAAGPTLGVDDPARPAKFCPRLFENSLPWPAAGLGDTPATGSAPGKLSRKFGRGSPGAGPQGVVHKAGARDPRGPLPRPLTSGSTGRGRLGPEGSEGLHSR